MNPSEVKAIQREVDILLELQCPVHVIRIFGSLKRYAFSPR